MAALQAVQYQEFDAIDDQPYLRLVSVDEGFTLRTGPSLALRRAVRERKIQRRRRTLVAVALVAGLAILSWPGHAFGGTTGAGLPTDLADSSVLASGMQYVVQPGDSLNSIAKLMNPLDPSVARVDLVRELRSTVVVPGEHILIP